MRRKRIFRNGIFIIIFSCFLNPLYYLTLGKIGSGVVTGQHIRTTYGRYSGTYISPIIDFQAGNSRITFYGEENLKYKVGDSVKVIFLPFAPGKAKILSFLALSGRSLIELGICLFIWVAFFSSFKTIFDKPLIFRTSELTPISANFKGDLPKSIRYLFKGILILFLIILSFSIISMIATSLKSNIAINSLFLITGMIALLMFFIYKELKEL